MVLNLFQRLIWKYAFKFEKLDAILVDYKDYH